MTYLYSYILHYSLTSVLSYVRGEGHVSERLYRGEAKAVFAPENWGVFTIEKRDLNRSTFYKKSLIYWLDRSNIEILPILLRYGMLNGGKLMIH